MPPDGTNAAPSSSEDRPRTPRESRGGHGRNRARFRRFIRIAYAVTGLSHIGPALALAWFLPGGVAVLVALALIALTVWRLRSLVSGGRRPWWVSTFADEPILTHWSAAMLSTLLLPVGFLVALAFAPGAGVALRGAALAGYIGSFALAAWGTFVRRRWVRVVHVEVPVAGLPPEFDGYRIAQVSDLHIGNFDPKVTGLAWAKRVCELEADLVAVTGDLVTSGTGFYEDVAEVVGAMRAKDGVCVVLGNHDQWDPDSLTRLLRERGARVLRNESEHVRRGGAELRIAGIDDPMTGKADLDRTLAGYRAGAPAVLLSHYPDFFEEAAARGVSLVLSGHTHGGQVAVPFFTRRFSLSTLARQHAHGVHVRGKSRLFVNAGLGTTGPPMRVGVAPEIAVLVLRRP
jgi:predicted MPP superfamily phosphohydrolase